MISDNLKESLQMIVKCMCPVYAFVEYGCKAPDNWEELSDKDKLQYFLANCGQIADTNCTNDGIELGDFNDDAFAEDGYTTEDFYYDM